MSDLPIINADPEVARAERLRAMREALAAQRERQVVDARYTEISPFIRYDQDGAITESGEMAIGHIEDHRAKGDRILAESGKWDVHYVDRWARSGPRKRTKSACPAVLDGLTLRSLPLPCRIEISDPAGGARTYEETDDGVLALEFSHPGTYRVRVLSAPHTPGEWTVEVPA